LKYELNVVSKFYYQAPSYVSCAATFVLLGDRMRTVVERGSWR